MSVNVDGKTVHIAGAAKGSGMIHPNMATMLGFVTTDAAIGSDALQKLLRQATDLTFNMITVDGDTSTNDMLVAMASGLAGNRELTQDIRTGRRSRMAFAMCAKCLPKRSPATAKARRSWSRCRCAARRRRSGSSDREDGHRLVAREIGRIRRRRELGTHYRGGRTCRPAGQSRDSRYPPRRYRRHSSNRVRLLFDEEAALGYLKGDTVVIHVDLNMGEGTATAWGCDLTYDYVRINAAYRT